MRGALRAGGAVQAQDERALLLEEEHVVCLLAVDVGAQDPHRELVVVGEIGVRTVGIDRTAPGGGGVHHLADLVIGQLVRALGGRSEAVGVGAAGLETKPLEQKAALELEKENLLELLVIREGADAAEDLLPVLAWASVVNPHGWTRLRSACRSAARAYRPNRSGQGRCNGPRRPRVVHDETDVHAQRAAARHPRDVPKQVWRDGTTTDAVGIGV